MKINEALQKVQSVIQNPDIEKEEKKQQVLKHIVDFYMDHYQAADDEIAIFMPNPLGTSLKFVYPFYLNQADEIPIHSSKPIVSRIYRTGVSFLDNDLVDKERLFQYEFIKNYNDEARIIWKMMGCVIRFRVEDCGVIQISRKRKSFQKLGADFTPADLAFLEKSISEFAPSIKAIQFY